LNRGLSSLRNLLHLIFTAIILLSAILECDADDGKTHMENGLKAYKEEADFDKAILELQEAIRLGLDSQVDMIQAHLYLGFAHIGQADRANAEAEFAEAITLDPSLSLNPELHSSKTIGVFNGIKERLVDSLTIISTPGGAEAFLDGQSLGTTPLRLDSILIGKHSLKLVREYFQSKTLSIQVKEGKDNRISVQLDKSEMELFITSKPPEAVLYVAGKDDSDPRPYGKTPLSLKMVLDQELAVKLTKEEFLHKELKLKLTEAGVIVSNMADAIPVKEGVVRVEISLDPAPPPGSLRVTSDPPGATAYLDGIDLGETPLTIAKVTPGNRRIRVSMSGFTSMTRKIEVISGEETAVEMALGGQLRILSIPSEAQVFIDEEYAGITPLRTGRIPAGPRQIRVARNKYKDGFSAVMVERGKEKEVGVRLLPVKGSIAISSDPSGASVYLDGEMKGETPLFVYGVMVGQHSLRLASPGSEDWEKQITVEELKVSWQFVKLGS